MQDSWLCVSHSQLEITFKSETKKQDIYITFADFLHQKINHVYTIPELKNKFHFFARETLSNY